MSLGIESGEDCEGRDQQREPEDLVLEMGEEVVGELEPERESKQHVDCDIEGLDGVNYGQESLNPQESSEEMVDSSVAELRRTTRKTVVKHSIPYKLLQPV